MGRKPSKGLRLRGETWHIEKQINGHLIYESTETSSLDEAEEILAERIRKIRKAKHFGVRPKRTVRDGCTRFLEDVIARNLRSLGTLTSHIEELEAQLGDRLLCGIYDETIKDFVSFLREKGNKDKTVRNKLSVLNSILKSAAGKWRDPVSKLTWLESAPILTLPKVTDARAPYPLSWKEQKLLSSELAPHLLECALFALNTVSRGGEVSALEWNWEYRVPGLGEDIFVFVIPPEANKNDTEKLVVLNRVARKVVNAQRGKHEKHVFTYAGEPILSRFGNLSGWKGARRRASKRYRKEFGCDAPLGFQTLHFHDLRHTAGRRLRAAGISLETRRDLFGHKTGDITSHYSVAEIKELLDAVECIAADQQSGPTLTLIRRAA